MPLGNRTANLATRALLVALLVLGLALHLPGGTSLAQDGTPPSRPARPAATSISHDSVTITWDDPQDDSITGYRILRRNRDTDALGSFTVVEEDTGSADTSYTDGTLEPSTRYGYRVEAINAYGISDRSRSARFKTPAAPEPTPSPTPEPTATPEPTPDYAAERAVAMGLGDLVGAAPHTVADRVNLDSDRIDYFDFNLSERKEVRLRLKRQEYDADLYLEDPDGNVIHKSENAGAGNESINAVLDPTAAGDYYYVRVEAKETGRNDYEFRFLTKAPPQPQNSAATGMPTITGTVQVRETLTAGTSNIADDNGLSNAIFAYQWVRSAGGVDTAMSGATASTFLLTHDELDHTITVRVSFTDDDGYSETVASNATAPVVRPPNASPNGLPTISGTPGVGKTLTADASGITDGNGLSNAAFTYQWVRGTEGVDADIAGATSSSYTLTSSDAGAAFKVTAAFTDDDGYSETLTSGPTAVLPAPQRQEGNRVARVGPADGTVPDDWGLIPTGLGVGDSFRLLFLTSRTISLSHNYISTYNALVQAYAAGGHSAIQDYSALFKAVGSTQGTDARDNTGTTFTNADKGVPIYWLNGTKVADEYEDFYDGSWDDEANDKNESGTNGPDTSLLGNYPATGSDHDGTEAFIGTASRALGASFVRVGLPNSSITGDGPLGSSSSTAGTTARPLYGLSDVLTVVAAQVGIQEDDWLSSTGTGGSVTVGGSTTGKIQFVGDTDWFAIPWIVHVNADFGPDSSQNYDGRYRFDVDVSAADGLSLTDVGLRVFDAEHPWDHSLDRFTHLSRSEDSVNDVVSFHFYAGWTGPAHAEVYSLSGSTGTYELSFHKDSTLPADDQIEAGPWHAALVRGDAVVERGEPRELRPGDTLSGEIERPLDGDWFTLVDVSASTTYTLELDLTSGERIEIQGLFDDDGELLAEAGRHGSGGADGDDEWGDYLELTTPAAAATLHVLVGSGSKTGAYTLSLSEGVATVTDDYTASGKAPGWVRVGGTATGEIETAGDADGFGASLFSGVPYRIELKGADTGHGTLPDPQIRNVAHPKGYRVTGSTDDDGGTGRNSRLEFTPPHTGVYIIRAGGKSGTGTYTLTLDPLDDHSADILTSGNAPGDGDAAGEIDFAGDVDWFRVGMGAGVHRIDLRGSASGYGTLADPEIEGVYDSEGVRYGNSGDDDSGSGNDSRVTFTVLSAGAYYVAAAAAGSGTGTYTLSITDGSDHEGASHFSAGTMSHSAPEHSRINASGDVDWFRTHMQLGRTYRIEVKGSATGHGTLSDPRLVGIYNSAGAAITGTEDDNGGTGNNAKKAYKPDYTGYHYVSVGATGSGTGTYVVSAKITDDFPSDNDTFGRIGATGAGAGGYVDGSIETGNDRDRIRVDLPALSASASIIVDLIGRKNGFYDQPLDNPRIRGIYDESDSKLTDSSDDNGGVGNNSRVTLHLSAGAAESLFVEVDSSGSGTGSYRLTVRFDDFPADVATERFADVGSSQIGVVQFSGDRDWHKIIDLEQGTNYTAYLVSEGLDDPKIWGVRDASGERVPGTVDDGGTAPVARLDFEPDAAGHYFFDIGDADDGTGSYTFKVAPYDDYSSDIYTTGRVPVDAVQGYGLGIGEIETNADTDWFKITLEPDVVIDIHIRGAATREGTLFAPKLEGLYDAQGTRVLAEVYGGGAVNPEDANSINLLTSFTAPATGGVYFIAAGSRTAGPTPYTGTYVVDVVIASGGGDDCKANTSTTCSVTVGSPAMGELETEDDADWWAVDLEMGKTYQIDLQGYDSSLGTLDDPEISGVYDSSGTFISGTFADDGGSGFESRVVYTATSTGTYYIHASTSFTPGTYTLTVQETDPIVEESVDEGNVDCTEGTGTTCSMTVGSSATGRLATDSDIDWWAIDLETGKTYLVDLQGEDSSSGTLPNPEIDGIYNSSGHYISGTFNDDGGTGRDSRVEYTATSTGTYYISALTSEDDGGTYTLTVTDITQ